MEQYLLQKGQQLIQYVKIYENFAKKLTGVTVKNQVIYLTIGIIQSIKFQIIMMRLINELCQVNKTCQ